jgi:MFS superfamily sulfate permease-like transporter
MLATVVVVVATHNLAFGVLTGVLIASLNFATKVARFMACNLSSGGRAGRIPSPARYSLPQPTAL